MANGNANNGKSGRAWIAPVVALLIVILAIGAYVELRPRRIRISVVMPVRESISNSITTNGKVEPVHGFEAHAPLAGTVEKVLVKEGEQVKKGQLLLVLDDSAARVELATAETRLKSAQERYANMLAGGTAAQLLVRRTEEQKADTDLDSAQREFEALERLERRGAATGDEVAAARDRLARVKADIAQYKTKVRYSPLEAERAQREIDDARLNIQVAEETLRKCNVRAPFSGTVYLIPVRAGNFANVGELLLQEADLNDLRVRAFVDEPEIGHLALGENVQITWDAMPGHVWEGRVESLPSTVVARGSRVVGEVLCKFDNTDHPLMPSVNVNTTIISSSKKNALTVPREAVQEDAEHDYVYVVQDKHLHRHDIQVGISNLTRVEVLSGITDHDVIAVQSFSPTPMKDGIEVKIVENPT